MDRLITKLYKFPKMVLTNKDLAMIWVETDMNRLKSKISYYAKQGALIRLTRGVFAKDKNYNPKELATSIYTPSYISFETVLRESGIIFQHYHALFAAAPYSMEKKIDKHSFTFRKLKDAILYNPLGIENKENYSIATPERAFLDMLYLFPNYYFDNLRPIRWEQCKKLVRIYGNQQLVKRLVRYQKKYAQ